VENDFIKVVKFGGSSLADAEQFKKVRDIIFADPSRRFVVPSAPGKRFSGDIKITDLLYTCHSNFIDGRDYLATFEKIKHRYNKIIKELGLELSLDDEYSKIIAKLEGGCKKDYMASRGEYLNGIILAKYLGFSFIDAADVVFFNENGTLNDTKTNCILSNILRMHENAVVPGFYGALPDGTVKTFSRGGSDISGSLVARAVGADLYENWTDISGFKMADPRIIENPKTIDVITYHELRELAYMGATVLHEDAVFPVRIAGIPINIRNTNSPADKGTMIVAHSDPSEASNIITGVAGRSGFSVITIDKDMMNSELGFGRRVLQVLENYGISFEHLPSGIDSMGVIVSTEAISNHKEQIVTDICRAVEPDTIYIEDGLSLIAVVGRGMVNNCGTAARLFTAVANAGINIRMIDQGSSECNIIISVEEKDYVKAMKAIYNEFID